MQLIAKGFDVKISIHAPREGSDEKLIAAARLLKEFQSTLPVKGATFGSRWTETYNSYFNPRSP